MVGYFSESTTPWPSIQLAMSYYSLINTKINIRVEHVFIFTDVKEYTSFNHKFDDGVNEGLS